MTYKWLKQTDFVLVDFIKCASSSIWKNEYINKNQVELLNHVILKMWRLFVWQFHKVQESAIDSSFVRPLV